MVLDLSGEAHCGAIGMQALLANLLPKPDVDPRHRRLTELEAMVLSREEQ